MNIGHLQHFISSESNYGKYKLCSLEIKTHRKGDPLPWPAQDSPSMTTTQVPFHSEKRILIGTTRVFSRSVMSDSLWPQAPVSMRFYRQEYWSGLPYPPPGDLLDPGIKPGSPALQADSLPSKPAGAGKPLPPAKCHWKALSQCLVEQKCSTMFCSNT